jgi:hypothetical protein
MTHKEFRLKVSRFWFNSLLKVGHYLTLLLPNFNSFFKFHLALDNIRNMTILGHSMSSERMKKPDHLRFYSYLVDLKYHGR